MRKNLLLPLNIQLFAERENGNEGGEDNSQPSVADLQAQIEALKNENAKNKSALDKTNAENKKYKDAERARLSDEEKNKIAQEEQAQKYAEMEKRLRKSELTSALAGSFSSEHTSKIVEAIIEGKDDNALAKLLCDIRKSIVEETEKSVKESIRKNTYTPSGNGGSDSDESIGLVLAKKKGGSKNKAMEYFDNLKKR